MLGAVVSAYHRLEDARPLVRPTYSQLEVALFPPYGDPEVDLLGELGTYIVAGLFINAIIELLHDERDDERAADSRERRPTLAAFER